MAKLLQGARGLTLALVMGLLAVAGCSPGDPLARSQAAAARGDWASAHEAARLAQEQRPDDPAAIRALARAEARIGRSDTARTLYVQLQPEQLQAEDFARLADGWTRDQNLVLAWPAWLAAVEADPGHIEATEALAALQKRKAELVDASEVAERFAALAGPATKARLLLGLIRTDGRADEPAVLTDALLRGFQQVRFAYNATPPPGVVERLLARTLLALGRPTEARARLETLLQAGPDREASWLLSRACLQLGDATRASSALADAQGYNADDQLAAEPAPFVGSQKCGTCHADFHQTQQASHHARSYPIGEALAALPFPTEPVPDPADPGVQHRFLQAEGQPLRVETRKGDEVLQAVVEYAFGSGDRGLTLVGREPSGGIREFRLSYYGATKSWDRTTGQTTQPGSLAEFHGRALPLTTLHACLDCHTTEVRAARDHAGPASADLGIGCERCHGPGGHHVASAELKFAESAIALPSQAKAAEITNLCGQCHQPRGGPVANSARSSARFQAAMLPQSRCYDPAGHDLTCVTCHNPHQNARTSPAFYESKCLTCHGGKPASGNATVAQAAIPNCSVNPRDGCIKCHMPVVEDALNHSAFTDHFIRIVRPEEAGSSSAAE